MLHRSYLLDMAQRAKHWRRLIVRGDARAVSSLDATPTPRSFRSIDCGILETGRTRVFAGYFVRVLNLDRSMILGTHPTSLRHALRDVADQLAQNGFLLNAAGLRGDWVETGLSWNSGWGYWRDISCMHMLDPIPDLAI